MEAYQVTPFCFRFYRGAVKGTQVFELFGAPKACRFCGKPQNLGDGATPRRSHQICDDIDQRPAGC